MNILNQISSWISREQHKEIQNARQLQYQQQKALEDLNKVALQQSFFEALRCMSSSYRFVIYSSNAIEIRKGTTTMIAQIFDTLDEHHKDNDSEKTFGRLLNRVFRNMHTNALEKLRQQLYADAQEYQASLVAFSFTEIWQGKTLAELFNNFCIIYRGQYTRLFNIVVSDVRLLPTETEILFECVFEDKCMNPVNYQAIITYLINGGTL